MNKCIDAELQELLPDLLHESLDGETRQRVEAHLATCESCKEDLEVLRTVKGAAVFAPAIDVDSIVRQIPPYRVIVPSVEQPKRTRMVSWLVAAGLALAVAGGGTLVMSNQGSTSGSSQTVTASVPEAAKGGSQKSVSRLPQATGVAEAPNQVVASAAVATPALALATNLDDLSDGNLVQLMNDMDNFDALPAAEPEPVIAVDSGDSL
jgi:anti-sigma factor RsiW